MIRVEYLLPFDTENGICKDINSFNCLLSSNSNFKITTDSITFKSKKYSFEVSSNEVLCEENTNVFHVCFSVKKVTENFTQMLKLFQQTIGLHLKDKIHMVWNGIAFEWSKELYPKIYEVENLLRKLISKFMLTKLGIGWHSSYVPNDVKESIKKEGGYKSSLKIMYEVDFIQLANFLFKPFSIKDSKDLPAILDSLIIDNQITQDKKNEINDYIPRNNWDRYFKELVECESGQLEKKWKNLYDIRCKVAHNNSLEEVEYKNGLKLCESLKGYFEKAFINLDNIKVSLENIENISLKTIGTVNESTEEFVEHYIGLNYSLSKWADINAPVSTVLSGYSYIDSLLNSNKMGNIMLSESVQDNLYSINNYKNELLSGTSVYNINNGLFQVSGQNILDSIIASNVMPLEGFSPSKNHLIFGNGIDKGIALSHTFVKNDGLSLGVAKSKDDILYNSGISLDNGVSLGHTVMKNDGLSLGVAKSKNDILSSENISKDNKVSKVRKDLKK